MHVTGATIIGHSNPSKNIQLLEKHLRKRFVSQSKKLTSFEQPALWWNFQIANQIWKGKIPALKGICKLKNTTAYIHFLKESIF